MASIVRATQATIETAQEWGEAYHPVPLESHLERQWKVGGDSLPAIQIIQRLTDAHKPHLPEGYIWGQEQQRLQILKHRHAPASSFKIHLFGPDNKERIQFVVEKEKVPQHGFSMTRREGFPRDLRDDYPMSPESFRSRDRDIPQWRGHIIDYQDTLGTPEEENISTRQPWNFKPEPPEHWARTLRTKIVGNLREIEGSYAEIMLYGFLPTETVGGNPIPRAIVLETFLATKEFQGSYHIPQDHECHGWTARRHPTAKALRELRQNDLFPALIWKSGAPPATEMKDVLVDPEHLDVKDAYRLLRSAEMEYDQATFKILYVIYGKTHQSSLETLQFWLLRAVDIAIKVDSVYHSSRPPFPTYLMNCFQGDLDPSLTPYVDQLKSIAGRILQAPSPDPQIAPPAPEMPRPIEAAVTPREATPDIPISILCSGDERDESQEISEKIGRAIKMRGVVILKKVISSWANKWFGQIQEQIQGSPSRYQPIRRVELSNARWRNTVTSLTRKCFGEDVVIALDS